jgi:hypothetical protein
MGVSTHRTPHGCGPLERAAQQRASHALARTAAAARGDGGAGRALCGVLTGYPHGTHGVLTGYSQLRAVTAERDAFSKAHAQCEALYAALAAQHGLKANAHGAAQPLLAG